MEVWASCQWRLPWKLALVPWKLPRVSFSLASMNFHELFGPCIPTSFDELPPSSMQFHEHPTMFMSCPPFFVMNYQESWKHSSKFFQLLLTRPSPSCPGVGLNDASGGSHIDLFVLHTSYQHNTFFHGSFSTTNTKASTLPWRLH